MDVAIRRADPATRATGLLAVGLYENHGALTGVLRTVDRASRGAISTLIASGDWKGRRLESVLLYPKGLKTRRLLVIGLGRREERSPQALLLAAAHGVRRARDLGAGTLALALHESGADAAASAAAVAQGAVLGHWRHTAYRTGTPPAPLARVELIEPSAAAVRRLGEPVERGALIGEAVCLARDLANTPAADLVPVQLAERAADVARDAGAKFTAYDVEALERLGMGGVLAVGRGSPNAPRFLVLDRPASGVKRGAKAPTIVVIGKGVTFDTGGISLKPREGMNKMKYDMAGAAAVLGLFHALPALEPHARIVGLIPAAENAIGSRAMRPGDVVRALDGTTIEITNTDAEGRLLLADALGYAQRFGPTAVVDLATLTGAIAVALGRHFAGLFCDDDRLAAELTGAGAAVGEPLWRMPMGDEYLAEMKSDTADLVNSNEKREGPASTAAAFLKHFAKDLRWAHLDIAGTGWTYVERAHESRGANGFGVRLLVEWIRRTVRCG